jgi:hypothetical protein
MSQSPQKHGPQMMQPPYLQPPTPSQHLHSGLMPSANMNYPQPQSNLLPMTTQPMPLMPSPQHSESAAAAARTLKKRKTTENLRGKENNNLSMRRDEASQYAQDSLDHARHNPTLGNLVRAYQQHDMATRTKPSKVSSDGSPLEGLDSTIQLFQMSCEDMAQGVEADQARMRGERWLDHVGIPYLMSAIDTFLNDFQGRLYRFPW